MAELKTLKDIAKELDIPRSKLNSILTYPDMKNYKVIKICRTYYISNWDKEFSKIVKKLLFSLDKESKTIEELAYQLRLEKGLVRRYLCRPEFNYLDIRRGVIKNWDINFLLKIHGRFKQLGIYDRVSPRR